MRRWKLEQQEKQRRKMALERKLTPKQLDALAAVVYGELEMVLPLSGAGAYYAKYPRWMLDGVNISGRIKTLRGYKFLQWKRAERKILDEFPYELTDDGLAYLKSKGII